MDRRNFLKCGFMGSALALVFKPLTAFGFMKTSKPSINGPLAEIDKIKMDDNDIMVAVYFKYNKKEYSAYLLIPPEKQNMKHISTQTSVLAGSIDRTLKPLLGLDRV